MRHKWGHEDKWNATCTQCGLVKTIMGQMTEYRVDDAPIGSRAGDCTGEKPAVPKKKKERKGATPINAVMTPAIEFLVPPGMSNADAREKALEQGCNVLSFPDGRRYTTEGKRCVSTQELQRLGRPTP